MQKRSAAHRVLQGKQLGPALLRQESRQLRLLVQGCLVQRRFLHLRRTSLLRPLLQVYVRYPKSAFLIVGGMTFRS